MAINFDKYKTVVYGFANRPYIPETLRSVNSPLILHISDTPVEIYRFLYRVIEQLRPAVILHTGDVADNFKIEFQKNHLVHYQRSVLPFLKRLHTINGAKVYVVQGNHDETDILLKAMPGSRFDDRTVMLFGRKFHLMHIMDQAPVDPGFYCFGHRFEPHSQDIGDHVLLNGLNNINVIDTESWQIYHLGYPVGTNGYRKMSGGRMGL
jgi:predicted phosphodiesterase